MKYTLWCANKQGHIIEKDGFSTKAALMAQVRAYKKDARINAMTAWNQADSWVFICDRPHKGTRWVTNKPQGRKLVTTPTNVWK